MLLALTTPTQATPRTEAAARLAETERLRAEQAQTQVTARRDLSAAQAQAAALAVETARQAAALQIVEGRVLAASAGLAEAAAREQAAQSALARTQADFAALLPVMLRMSQAPAETMLAAPGPPEQALRGLLVTQGLAVSLNRQAAALRAAQAAAGNARAATAQQRSALAAERAAQAARAAALDRVVAQARDQVAQAEADNRAAAEQVAAAAARAQTLREAIAAMDAARARAAAQAAREAAAASHRHQDGVAQAARARQAALRQPVGPRLSQLAGKLVPPVAGPVLRAFGAAAEDGPATGITYGVAGGAYVSSPCNGRVAFAAPFRSYGQLLILECGGGTDIVLAGLGTIGARPGHAVRQGEPLGRMPDAAHASLYVELRAGGRAVDPAPFLKAKL